MRWIAILSCGVFLAGCTDDRPVAPDVRPPMTVIPSRPGVTIDNTATWIDCSDPKEKCTPPQP